MLDFVNNVHKCTVDGNVMKTCLVYDQCVCVLHDKVMEWDVHI